MSRIVLRRGNKRVSIPVDASRVGKMAYNIGKRAYGMYKSYRNKRNNNKTTGVSMNYGRTIMKLPINLNRNAKRAEKTCRNMVKKKIALFKNAIMQKANQIFYFVGTYQGVQFGRHDNDNYPMQTGTKLLPLNGTVGGGLGHAINGVDFTNDATAGNTYHYSYGNNFTFCHDTPSSMTVPNAFAPDLRTAGVTQFRKFGMTSQPIYGEKQITALNNLEDVLYNNVSPSIWTNITNAVACYNLSYKYTFEFLNTTFRDHYVYIATYKLNHMKANDTGVWDGISNWINNSLRDVSGQSFNIARDYMNGKLPSVLFKTIKIRRILLRGSYNAGRNVDTPSNYRKLIIKSRPNYISSARRPTEIRQTTSDQCDSTWWNENYTSYTYSSVWSVPVLQMGVGSDATLTGTFIGGQILYRVKKETSYALMTSM